MSSASHVLFSSFCQDQPNELLGCLQRTCTAVSSERSFGSMLISLSRCLKFSRSSSHPERLVGKSSGHYNPTDPGGYSNQEQLVKWIWENFSALFRDTSVCTQPMSPAIKFFQLSLLLDVLKAGKQTKSLFICFQEKKNMLFEFLSGLTSSATTYTPSVLKMCDLIAFLSRMDMARVLQSDVLCMPNSVGSALGQPLIKEKDSNALTCLPFTLEVIELLIGMGEQLVESESALSWRPREDSCALVNHPDLTPAVRATLILLCTESMTQLLRQMMILLKSTGSEDSVNRVCSALDSLITLFKRVIKLLRHDKEHFVQSLISSNDEDMIQILIYIEEISLYCRNLIDQAPESLYYASDDAESGPGSNITSAAAISTRVLELFSSQNCLSTLCLFVSLLHCVSYDHCFFLDLLSAPETAGLEYLLRVLKAIIKQSGGLASACMRWEAEAKAHDSRMNCSRCGNDQEDSPRGTVIWLELEDSSMSAGGASEAAAVAQARKLLCSAERRGHRVAVVEWKSASGGCDKNSLSEGESGVEGGGDGGERVSCDREHTCEKRVILFFHSLCTELECMQHNGSISFDCSSLIRKLRGSLKVISGTVL